MTLAIAGAALPAIAQQAPAPEWQLAQADTGSGAGAQLRSPIVTLDRDRLYTDSQPGKAALARFEQETQALIAENRRLESALEQEERELTARRATLSTDEFRKLADEFDARVEELRKAQDAKSRALTRRREEDQQAFFQAAVPILGGLMVEINAVAIVDRSAIILSFDQIDITDLAIQKLDAELVQPQPLPAEEAPATGTTPDTPKAP